MLLDFLVSNFIIQWLYFINENSKTPEILILLAYERQDVQFVFKWVGKARDAGAIVGQGGGRGTQGHSRPRASEASRKFGVPGVLSRKNF